LKPRKNCAIFNFIIPPQKYKAYTNVIMHLVVYQGEQIPGKIEKNVFALPVAAL
jgi:hypothetical protein